MTHRYIAAIDQGTTSSRCIVFDVDGIIVALDQREHAQLFLVCTNGRHDQCCANLGRPLVRALREDLAEAEEHNDLGRAERAREELDFIARELSRAVGLSGRARRTGTASERARVSVQRRVTAAIRKVAEHDQRLARYLKWAVRTGTHCCFYPHGRPLG